MLDQRVLHRARSRAADRAARDQRREPELVGDFSATRVFAVSSGETQRQRLPDVAVDRAAFRDAVRRPRSPPCGAPK